MWYGKENSQGHIRMTNKLKGIKEINKKLAESRTALTLLGAVFTVD